MKKTLLSIIIAVVAVFTGWAQTTIADLNESARTRYEKAITLIDTGMSETAIEILSNLDKEYPNNFNVQRFLVAWCTNSDEISVEIRDCSVAESQVGMLAFMIAMIEYGLEHKVKNPGEEGFAYAVKKALAYLDKNRAVVEVPERAEECLKMTPTQLDQRIHEEYNVPIESLEMLKP